MTNAVMERRVLARKLVNQAEAALRETLHRRNRAHESVRAADLAGGSGTAGKFKGACAQTDPEAFFPEKGGSPREAKAVCGRCWVKDECLRYAMAHDERFGIWGGLTARERRRLKKAALQRELAAMQAADASHAASELAETATLLVSV